MLDVLVILDRSGSMQSAQADHEGGLRSFVQDQKDLTEPTNLTLIQFDSAEPCQIIYDRAPIADVRVEDIRLIPRGGTPLLDAVGKAVAHMESHKPDHVVCLIITDGEENESHEWTREQVKQRVEALTKAGWNFLYLGANVDAFHEARGLGVSPAMAMSFANRRGNVGAAYVAASSNVARGRGMVASARKLGVAEADAYVGFTSAMAFDDVQRSTATSDEVFQNASQTNDKTGGQGGTVSGAGDSESDSKAKT